jgi:hypothetical protein
VKTARVFLNITAVSPRRPAGADPFTYREARLLRYRASWWTRGTSTEVYRSKLVASQEAAVRLARTWLARENKAGARWIDTTDQPERFGYEHEPAISIAPRDTDPPSLAEAARRAGHEPETEEGGRAMMQALTPAHLQQAEAVRKMRTLQPGDEIEYTNFTVGGSFKGRAVVTWDHGRNVEARTLGGEKLRLERAPDGSLRRFT